MVRSHGQARGPNRAYHQVVLAACGLSVLIILAACDVARSDAPLKSSPYLRVTGTIPAAGEKLRGPLTVIFSEPIRLAEDGDEATTQPLRFEPSMDSEFTLGPNSISFNPELVPYKKVIEARVAPSITSSSGKALAAEDARAPEISRHVPGQCPELSWIPLG